MDHAGYEACPENKCPFSPALQNVWKGLVIKQASNLVLANNIWISLCIPAVRILCVCINNLWILRTYADAQATLWPFFLGQVAGGGGGGQGTLCARNNAVCRS